MKHLLPLTVCASLVVLSGTARAQNQDASFTGLALGLSLSMGSNTVEYGGFLADHESKKSAAVSRVDASYGFNLSPRWVLSTGATYNLTQTDFGRISYRDNGQEHTVSGRLIQDAAIYVAPGYRIAPNWLAYGKLGLHQAKSRYRDTGTTIETVNHSGTGFGFGMATVLTKQIEGRLEYEQVAYSRETRRVSNGQPKTSQMTFYVGYRF